MGKIDYLTTFMGALFFVGSIIYVVVYPERVSSHDFNQFAIIASGVLSAYLFIWGIRGGRWK